MRPEQRNRIRDALRAMFCDRPTSTVSTWCEQTLIFDEPDNRGPYSLAGREYCREPLDSFSDPNITDGVLVFGSQSGKTGVLMGGASWLAHNDPARVIWVMAAEKQAQTFAETRWLPLLRASPVMAAQLPAGARRHDVKKLQQCIGASIVNFFGSNSPGNLASIPARICIQDEVDKFDGGGRKEADAVSLADQRTKKFANPKRMKSSTPTLVDGLIWQEFLKTDQRRRFVPCPHCSRLVVLSWAKAFTVFPITGAEAFVRWDNEAKRPDKSWDLDRVERSARAECPYCAGHILDGHKSRIDRAGQWKATASAAAGYRGWHLPSLYASSAQTTFGKLAIKFLQSKRSLMGLQGFINGDLAEPWENQDSRSERYEIIVHAGAAPLAGEALRLLTADHQLVSPFFWYIIRDWFPTGDSRLVAAGSCEEWSTLREIQTKHQVADNRVIIDHKYATATVNTECLRWGKLHPQAPGRPPIWVGWMPARGFPENSKWKDKKTGVPMIYSRQSATADDARIELPVLYFNGPACKDILAKLRRGPEQAMGLRWELTDAADETYFRHLDAEVLAPTVGRTGKVHHEWRLRSKRWPNHLLDCEVEQIAAAMFHRRLRWADAMIQQTDTVREGNGVEPPQPHGRPAKPADDRQLSLSL